VEYLKYVCSKITNDARWTRKIRHRIHKARAAFSKKKTFFTNKLDLNLRKKVVKCCIWSIGFYGSKASVLRKVIRNTLKVLKCGAGEGWRSVGPIV
jgi:endonuclease III-like uncharacterized protein